MYICPVWILVSSVVYLKIKFQKKRRLLIIQLILRGVFSFKNSQDELQFKLIAIKYINDDGMIITKDCSESEMYEIYLTFQLCALLLVDVYLWQF